MRTLTIRVISYADPKNIEVLSLFSGSVPEVIQHLHHYCPHMKKTEAQQKIWDALLTDKTGIHLGCRRAFELLHVSSFRETRSTS